MRPARAGFTLLEVVIAMAILAIGLTVLVSSQSTAVMMTQDATKIRTATLLAQEKMSEALLRVELEGFTDQDIEEEGDFLTFGQEDFRGDGVDLDLGDDLDGFEWAYTIRDVEISLGGDLSGMAADLIGDDYLGEGTSAGFDESAVPDLGDFVSPDMISDQLSPYFREVRVLVWWGDNEDGTDQVELLTHAINPEGAVFPGGNDPGTDL